MLMRQHPFSLTVAVWTTIIESAGSIELGTPARSHQEITNHKSQMTNHGSSVALYERNTGYDGCFQLFDQGTTLSNLDGDVGGGDKFRCRSLDLTRGSIFGALNYISGARA
jgi:hypothetical protein